MTIAAIHALFLQSTGIVIDTRKITTNALFVALKGERFDANTFAAEALQLGAAYVLIDNPAYYINEQTILKIAETGVDFISVGALTHSYKCLDLSLKAKI
jgi:UDP-N-acetylmuramyl pentapeptide synthase